MATPRASSSVTIVRAKFSRPRFQRRLAAASDEEMKAQQRERLKEAAELVAEEARNIASEFSTRIPPATRVMGGVAGVRVETNSEEAPNAWPFETGAYHPLFGNKHHWYQQEHRPYMAMAAERKASEAAEKMAEVLDDWADSLGL